MSARPQRPDSAGFPTKPRRHQRQARAALALFALALVGALGAVLVLIGAGSGHAIPAASAALSSKNDWVGVAAIASVLVSAVAGVAFLRRQVTSRRR